MRSVNGLTIFPAQSACFTPARGFAKGARKKKKDAKSKTKVDVATIDDSPIDLEMCQEKIFDLVGRAETAFDKIKLGRAAPDLLDEIKVKAYGDIAEIQDIGSVSARSDTLLIVNVHDQSLVDEVELAIRNAGLDLAPFSQNKQVHVPMPKPTAETRDKFKKLAKKAADDAKSRIRGVRQDWMKKLKRAVKESSTSEDTARQVHQNIQDFADAAVDEVSTLLETKEGELSS